MTKIFIGGSRRLTRLNKDIRQRIDNIIEKSFTVLIGDANGIDKSVQKYCMEKNYNNVIVFFTGNSCRNNIGNWPAKNIATERKTRDFKYYTAKDKEMAKEADYGFMIWDAKSSGTLNNIVELVFLSKMSLVYFYPDKCFCKIKTPEDVNDLLYYCDQESLKSFETKLGISKKIGNIPNQQYIEFTGNAVPIAEGAT